MHIIYTFIIFEQQGINSEKYEQANSLFYFIFILGYFIF